MPPVDLRPMSRAARWELGLLIAALLAVLAPTAVALLQAAIEPRYESPWGAWAADAPLRGP